MTGLYHGWDGEDDPHADFLHGGVDLSDFEDEVRHRKKRGKTAYKKKKRGCPGNDFGPHIYVWTTEYFRRDGSFDEWTFQYEKDFWDRNGFNRREYKTCVGCLQRVKSRYTEQFAKRVAKMGWYRATYGD